MKLYGLSTRIFSVQLHIHICSKPNDYSNSKNVITFKLQSYQSYGIAHVCYRGHHWTLNPFFATQVHRHTCRPHCRISRSNNQGYRSDCSSRRTCQVDSLSNRISYDLMYKLCHDYETKKHLLFKNQFFLFKIHNKLIRSLKHKNAPSCFIQFY